MTIRAGEVSSSSSGVVINESNWHPFFLKACIAEKLRRAGETVNESEMTKLKLFVFLFFFLPHVMCLYLALQIHHYFLEIRFLVTNRGYRVLKVMYKRLSGYRISSRHALRNNTKKLLNWVHFNIFYRPFKGNL